MESEIDRRASELLRFTKTHNSHRDAITKATGEHFNIFRILGVRHLEVATHSPILADLLNPKGTHGQKEVFLDLFLDQFEIEGFGSKSATAISELYIGPVTESSGGRIDIVIQEADKSGKTRRILIENKIYASDQPNQLIRYRNFDKDAPLFYLTLFGDEPDNVSTDKAKEIDFKSISYSEDILSWLQKCRKEAVCLPGVREIISQYIVLIEELTRQNTTLHMNEKLITEIVSDPESFKAFQTLRGAESAVSNKLWDAFFGELDQMALDFRLTRFLDLDKNPQDRYYRFAFEHPFLKECGVDISFQFGGTIFQDLTYGFSNRTENLPCSLQDRMREKFSAFADLKPANSWWPASAHMDAPFRYWGDDAFEGLRSGVFAKLVQAKVEIMLDITEQLEKGI